MSKIQFVNYLHGDALESHKMLNILSDIQQKYANIEIIIVTQEELDMDHFYTKFNQRQMDEDDENHLLKHKIITLPYCEVKLGRKILVKGNLFNYEEETYKKLIKILQQQCVLRE